MMKHRVLSMLLALVMAVSLLPVAALADGEGLATEERLPTAADEENATQLYVDRDLAATSYVRYEKDDVFRLPFLFYLNGTDGFVPVKTIQGFMEPATKCYAIQTMGETRQTFGQVEIHPDSENPFILWKDFPENMNWTEAEKASYVLMFWCNEQWYKLDAQLHAGSASLAGGLVMQYNGRDYFAGGETVTLPAGEYKVALMDGNGNSITESSKLSVDGSVVTNLQKTTTINGEGQEITLWQFELAQPEDKTADGYIEYVDNEDTSRINIRCIQEVTDVFVRQGTDEYSEISDNMVTPFEWNGHTYYLGTAEYQENLGNVDPYGQNTRGVIQEDGSYQEMFFAPRVFEYSSDDYKLREDIRKEIENAGYKFKLELLPTDYGCKYYPVTIPVRLRNVDSNGGETAESWEQHLVTEESIGSWVYKASIVKNGDKQTVLAENMSMASYQANVYTYISVGENTVENTGESITDEIKTIIGDHWENISNDIRDLVEAELYNDFVVLQLPSGEIKGQIEIPDTLSLVVLRGAGFNDSRLISTTIRGGVKLGNVYCNVKGIRFIGDGKTNEFLADGVTRNSAIYGEGQGVYNGCIFENYYCALHSSENCAPAWGGWSSVFYENAIALHLDTTLGGNLEMVDNWFVGNGTAILMDDALEEIYLLQSRQNRFVNNDYDLVNNSGKTMWMSYNFFYHDYDATDSETVWEPALWEEVKGDNDTVIGLQLKRNGENGAVIAENDAPAFTIAENYNSDPEYFNFLPWFDGNDKTLAYPLARTQDCNTFFRPNYRDQSCPSWQSLDDPYYPSYVQQGVTISEDELDGLRFSSYDSEEDVVTATFDFGASTAEAEN